MAKKLDLTKSVHDLVKEYPEVKDIMVSLGFTEIGKAAMLQSVGRVMTIPKGSEIKDIPMDKIIAAFGEAGFEIEGYEGASAPAEDPAPAAAPAAETETAEDERNAMLKHYLKRLNQGEDLEDVRRDFVANFADVDPSEIMKAEQELIAEGTPLAEVQQLCDVHSALFHGATREEKIANAEAAAVASMKAKKDALRTHYDEKIARTEEEVQAAVEKAQKLHESVPKDQYTDKQTAYAEIADVYGHPVNTYVRENAELMDLITKTREKMAAGEDTGAELKEMRQLSIHYASKGDLIYPVLDARYDITGPSNVMWTVDDEIRDEMGALEKETDHNAEWNERFEAVMARAEEMIYKEENILFPICAVNFTPEEWKGIYRDSMDYDLCFGVEKAVWEEAEAEKAAGTGIYAKGVGEDVNANKPAEYTDEEIVLPGGHMTKAQLRALLNTIPAEITFVDDQNMNRFFNEGPKVFKRPGMAIDREVWTCHPPKVEPMVRAIINDFREGTRDEVPVWMEKGGRSMLVRYIAVRDTEGNYVGTLEYVQDMEFAKEHFTSQEDK